MNNVIKWTFTASTAELRDAASVIDGGSSCGENVIFLKKFHGDAVSPD